MCVPFGQKNVYTGAQPETWLMVSHHSGLNNVNKSRMSYEGIPLLLAFISMFKKS